MTGLLYFTVYGPWARPDMSPIKFAKAIFAGEEFPVFNYGKVVRDFRYIDDIVEGTIRVVGGPPGGDPPYRIYNIGKNAPVPLLEEAIGKPARMDLQPMQRAMSRRGVKSRASWGELTWSRCEVR